MIIYLLLAAFLGGSLLGGFGVNSWKEGVIARQQAAQVKKQAEVDALAAKLNQEAANKLIDMQAAFDAGEAQQKTITKTVYVKGQDYVREAPQVFANPQCVLPANSLQLYNSEIARVRLAAAEALGIVLPSPGPDSNRGDGGAIHIVPGSAGPVPGMPAQLQPVPSTSGVPGSGVQRPPKPRPTGG